MSKLTLDQAVNQAKILVEEVYFSEVGFRVKDWKLHESKSSWLLDGSPPRGGVIIEEDYKKGFVVIAYDYSKKEICRFTGDQDG